MTFTHRLRVRYGECDVQGIAYNARYLIYADVAYIEWWRELAGSYAAAVADGVDTLLAEATVRYLAPVRADELVDIGVRVAELGKSSFRIAMSFERSDECVATVDLRYVFVDPASLRPLPPADRWREAIARYAE